MKTLPFLTIKSDLTFWVQYRSIHFIYRGWEMEAKEITKMDREIKKPEKKNGKIRKHNCKPSENHPWRRAIIGQKGMEQRQ